MHESQIPEVGQILLQYTPNKQFPYGFLGKVESVTKETSATKSGDVIKVKTGPVSIWEAFTRLYINEHFKLGREEAFPSTKGIDLNKVDKFITGGLAWTSTYHLILDFDLQNKINNISLTCTNSFDLHCELNFRLKANNDKDTTYTKTPLGPEIPLPSPVATIGIKPTIQFMQGYKLSGSCGFTYALNYTTSDSWTLSYNNGLKQLVRNDATGGWHFYDNGTAMLEECGYTFTNMTWKLEGDELTITHILSPEEAAIYGSPYEIEVLRVEFKDHDNIQLHYNDHGIVGHDEFRRIK